MESTVHDEQKAEQEAVGSQGTMTSTCSGTKETDLRGLGYETIMESDSDLLQPPTLEMLTNEIVNSGTQASVSPCHKASSQGSHDVSPSNDDTEGICNAPFSGELESCHVAVETTTEERHIDNETRPLKEENMMHFKEPETSSDDTDEWETASEKSFALDLESHDPHRVKEETRLFSQEKNNENAGIHSPKTISEEAGLHSHETVSESAGPPSQETVSEDAGFHGHETLIEDVESAGWETVAHDVGFDRQDTLIEVVEFHGQETVGESAGPHSHETFSEDADARANQELIREDAESHGFEMLVEEAEPHCKETVSEDAESHGHDTVSENARPHGHKIVSEARETVNEGEDLYGLESVSEETVSSKEGELFIHGDMDTTNREATHLSQDTSNDETRSYGQEKVNEEAEPHDQEMVSEETGSYSKEKTGAHVHEIVSDLTNSNEDTVVELVRPLGNETEADAELQDDETVSGMESEALDKDHKISSYKGAVLDQALNEITMSVDEETTDYKVTLSTERPGENLRDEINHDSTYNGVSKRTFSDTAYGDHLESQYVNIETVHEDVPNVYEETNVVNMERNNEQNQDVYKEVESHKIQDINKSTVGENILQAIPDSEDTEVGDAGMGETSEWVKEVLSDERINVELSSEEREMEDKQVQIKSNENRERNEFSETSRVLDESVTNEDELDDDNFKKFDLVEAFSKHVITEKIEIADLECERLEEELRSIKTFVGSSEGLLEGLTNVMNQETVLDYSTPVTIDEKSYMGDIMDLETQQDISGPSLTEGREQVDYVKTLSDIEPNSIELEDIKRTDIQNEPSDNLGLGYIAEPEVQVVSFDSQEISEPCLQLSGLDTQDTRTKDDSSFGLQNQGLADPEPIQEETITVEMLDLHNSQFFSQVFQDEITQESSRDEPDHYKLDFFPIMLQGIRVVAAPRIELGPKSNVQDSLPESIGTECITRQVSAHESVHQESTLGDDIPVIRFDQDSVTPGLQTTATNLENIKSLRRQRSNTDPGLIQEEKLQASSDTDDSFRGRLRSITPPCDKFTSSYAPTSSKTLEQSTTFVLNPMVAENKPSHRVKNTTPPKKYAFHPTQIFNPMLLLGHTQEESGFYQTESLRQSSMERASQRPLPPPPPQDNLVLRHTQKPEIIVVESKSSPKSNEGTSNIIKPMPTPSVAPVWLPPQRTRYVGDSGGVNEIRSLKTPENPLVRRPTIRHKRSNVGAKPTAKRFSTASLPAIPQNESLARPGTSNLPRIQSVNVSNIQISSRNRQSPPQPKTSEETGQPRRLSMESVTEEEHPAVKEKPSNNPESILLRGTRSKTKPPPSDPSQSIHRRYSTFINSSNLLYQEYSDVALNQEIQRQKPGDSPAEDGLPSSPRVRKRVLSSQDSYLQRLSISSADSLWQDIPKIRGSVTFLSMTREEQKLQEAKFELIMSEALYLRSLDIAVDHFQRSSELQEVLSAQDRQWLFSRLTEVRDASSDFLFDLEEEFESNMYNFQVCDVVIGHAPTFRRVYLPYVTNQSYQDRTFQTLRNNNPRFQQVLAKLESDPVCQRLSLKSFLILPFQRITRMRLLLQNILKRSAPGSTEELQATEAHNAVEKLIRDCNDGVQRMRDTEELILLNQKIQFECKIFPLISQSRRLVKHGELTTLEFNSMSFKWKVTTRPVYLHLFNDCLLMSRVREGGRFVVFDHASEFRVERCEIKLHTNQKNIFRVFLRDSAAMGRDVTHDVKETEYIFRTETQSQKLRWICALSSPKEQINVWKDHGLCQMQSLKSYKSRENDELSLEKADILMVTQHSDDGWLHGIRLSDQHSGWFPLSNVQPISRNACLRNLQEEQRLQTARAKLQPAEAEGH